MALTPEEVKAANVKRRKTVDVLDGAYRIRALGAGDLIRLNHEKRQAIIEGRNPEDVAFDYIACSWINAAGEPLFANAEGQAVARELDKDAYEALVLEIAKLNGISDQEIDAAVEDAGKN